MRHNRKWSVLKISNFPRDKGKRGGPPLPANRHNNQNMSTISKEAGETATEIIGMAYDWTESTKTVAECIQSLLDAQKADSDARLSSAAGALSDCRNNLSKALATITELRAACAEKDAALGKTHQVIRHLDDCQLIRFSFRPESKCTCGRESILSTVQASLSSHGESILAELKAKDEEVKRLKEDFYKAVENAGPCGACAEVIACGSTMHEHVGCAIAELSALRARAESAETLVKQLESVQVLRPQPLESAAAVKEQGDKV